MSFRDENDAARAKNEALERQLEETKNELEAARQELAESKKKREPKKERPKASPELQQQRRRMLAWLIGVPVACALVFGGIVMSESCGSVGVEERVGAHIVPTDCSCTSPDGTRYRLEGTVTAVGPDRSMPGRPTLWSIQWSLLSSAGSKIDLDSMGAPNTGIIGPLNYHLGIACPRADRIAIAGGGSVSMFAVGQGHALWTSTVMDAYESGGGLWGSGLNVSCDHIDYNDTYLEIPIEEGPDANIRIDSGRREY
jgi:hypothetical protein